MSEKQLPEISDTPQNIYVDICGAVTSPGVYELPYGSRVFQAIEQAGGYLPEAAASYLNRAKGLSERKVIYEHALPNAMLPIISVLSGQLANQLGGALVIEQVFSIPGIGLYLINAVNTRDYPVAQSSVVFLSILFSLIVLLTDLGYAAVDPIIRAQFVQGGTKKKKRKEENG